MPTDPHEHNHTQAQPANDGSDAPTPENAHGVGAQQQGQKPQTPPTPTPDGQHGGNHGNDQDNAGQPTDTAKGSSNRGVEVGAQSRNSGGGSQQEHANETKNTTDYKSDYRDGNAAPSPANDGGKIGDADNPA
ncbi:MAG: hypothetical protein WKG07_25200 [Hymenobacter sp.]